jgi:hypothetical protein
LHGQSGDVRIKPSLGKRTSNEICNCNAKLFDNPWARHQTAGLDFGVDALRWSDPTIPLETIGRSLREVLGLPERWPKE